MSVPLPARLSPSSWNLWDTCALQWRFRYVDHIEDPPSVAKEVGSFAHLVLEFVLGQPSAARTRETAKALAKKLYWSDPSTVAQGFITEGDFKRMAWYAISGLWELPGEDPSRVAVVATERRVEWTQQGVPMVAIVDRVERNSAGTLTISDYKSGSHKPKYQAQPKRQVAVGALAIASEEGFGEIGDRGKVLYVAEGKVEVAPTDPATLAGVSAQAEATWVEITEACAADDFPPRTGPLCAWCAHVAQCPEGQSQVRRSQFFRNPPPADAPGVVALAALEAAGA